MSRFNTSRAVSKTAAEAPPAPVRAAIATSAFEIPRAAESRPSLILPPAATDVSLMQRVGFALICILPFSAYANEFAMRWFHVKAYVSTLSWVLIPLMLVLSGNLLRGLRDVMGRAWFLFLAWLLLATPFSIWKGGSVQLLLDYVPRCWIQLYFCAAFLISVQYCRRYLSFVIAANFVLLLDCLCFGQVNLGRFDIPGSLFFNNANDLALQLLIVITQFMFLLYQRQLWKRVLGLAGILIALLYLLMTGSRGAFVGALALAAVTLIFGKNRIRFILAGVPIVLGLLFLAPSWVFHRLALIDGVSSASAVRDLEDASAIASQRQRVLLFRQSVQYAITHPLLGVGPGQFPVAASGDAAKEGQRPAWLGTHNSYTQVASECGIPALILYMTVIGVSLVSNYRIFRRTPNLAEYRDLSALAFCLFSATLTYAVCTFFSHIAYSGYLPWIGGMSIALRLGTDSSLWSSRARIRWARTLAANR